MNPISPLRIIAALAAASCFGATHAAADLTVIYQDNFDGDGLATNTGIGGGAGAVDTTPLNRGPGDWTDNGNLTSTGGSWGGTSANAFSLNGFDLRNGFLLEVTYNVVNSQTRLTIGILEQAGVTDPAAAGFATQAVVPYHGIVFNPVAYDSRNRFPTAPGLQYSDGTSAPQQLSNAQTNGVTGTHTVVLEMDADSNWSYSVDGAIPTTGTIGGAGFDLTRPYSFLVRNQKSSIGNQILSVTLSTTITTVAPVITSIAPAGGDMWELTLRGAADTGYEFLAANDLNFDPGTLIESLVQGDPDSDPGTVTSSNVLTTDGNGDGTVRMTLTGHPADFVRARIPPPPPPLLSEDFEEGDGGFTVSTTGTTAWAHGAPASSGDGGTVSGGNGGSANCWGTDIGSPGFYADVTDTCLRSSVIDLTGVAGAKLTFAEALDLEAGDTAVVNIIEEATDTTIASGIYTAGDGEINTADWTAVPAIDLAAGIGRKVRLEWCLTGVAGGTNDYMGWYIDDIVVTETTP